MDLQALRTRYLDELTGSVIPFWMKHGVDREYGGFLTCLDRDGSVFDDRKYIWMQGRGVWSFAKFYNDVERNPEWLEIARRGAEFLERYAFDPQGRCWFSTTRDGSQPVWYQRKPYAAVFAVLGFLEYAKASGDAKYTELALDLFQHIRRWIAEPALLDRPFASAESSADCMVILSMAIEIFLATGNAKCRNIVRECLLEAGKFYDPDRGILQEFPHATGDTPEGRLFCPGSSIEVAWFLIHGEEAISEPGPDRTARIHKWLDVIEASLELGWDNEFGGLYYFMDLAGKPTLQLESSMKLWWPHTEALYGCVLGLVETGDEKWARWLERVDAYAFRHFADPEYGEWFGYCDRQGNLTHTLKGNNYKGCFHVPRALLLSAQRIGQSEA
ncbi:MAG: AGE family epimerase/isomerase [Bryobacteraceae bacterium]